MITNIYVMIGIPGSGKTTFSKKYISEKSNALYISSDELRKELLNDENEQSKNDEIWKILQEKVEKSIGKFENILIDATHINSKMRNFYTKTLKQKYKKNIKVIAISYNTNLDIALKRNRLRNRFVPENVIASFYGRLEFPTIEEGFDDIISISDSENKYIKMFGNGFGTFLSDLIEKSDENSPITKGTYGIFVIKESLEKFISTNGNSYFENFIGLEQTSKYHKEDLITHISMIIKQIKEDYLIGDLTQNEFKLLIILALFHDIGKPFTRLRRWENLKAKGYEIIEGDDNSSNFGIVKNKKGETLLIQDFNDYQFIGHEIVSKKIFDLEILENELFITQEEKFILSEIIGLHLILHKIEWNEFEEKYKDIFSKIHLDEIYRLGKIFSEYDGKGKIN